MAGSAASVIGLAAGFTFQSGMLNTICLVTGLLVGVYAGLVLLATEVFLFRGTVAVAASTLVAAALF